MNESTALFYHTDNDGFGARVAFELYHPDAKDIFYYEYEYGQTFPEEAYEVEHLIFCDVTPDIDWIVGFVLAGIEVTVIDHHVSFYEKIYEDGAYSFLLDYPHFHFLYSNASSGCVLAYEYCDRLQPHSMLTPELFQYVQDKDLWEWKLNDSKVINAGLDSVPKTVTEWRNYIHDTSDLFTTGQAIVRHINATVELIAKQTVKVGTWKISVGLCNCTSHWSEVGNYLVSNLDYSTAFLYYDLAGGGRKWSIRGEAAREFAEIFGGGGHANASGFLQSRDDERSPFETVEEALWTYFME